MTSSLPARVASGWGGPSTIGCALWKQAAAHTLRGAHAKQHTACASRIMTINEVQHKTRHIYTRIQAHSITQCPKQNAVTSPNCYTVRGCNRYAYTRIGAAAAAAAATPTCNSSVERSHAVKIIQTHTHTNTQAHTVTHACTPCATHQGGEARGMCRSCGRSAKL